MSSTISTSHRFILFAAVSLDGYIAAPGNDLSFLAPYESSRIDYGFSDLMERIDSLVMGATTYRWEHEHTEQWPHGSLPAWVVSHRDDLPRHANAAPSFFAGDMTTLAHQIRERGLQNTWVVGGGDIVRQFLQHDLLDEIELCIVPTLLGGGVPLFPPTFDCTQLRHLHTETFRDGMVRVQYVKRAATPA